jgi:hypothetical protein
MAVAQMKYKFDKCAQCPVSQQSSRSSQAVNAIKMTRAWPFLYAAKYACRPVKNALEAPYLIATYGVDSSRFKPHP